MKTSYVYIIEYQWYEDHWLLGIYSSLEKAKKALPELEEYNKTSWERDGFRINKYKIDSRIEN